VGRRLLGILAPPLVALVLLEGALRVLTTSGAFAGIPLLPLDPLAPVRAARGADFAKTYLVFDRELGWVVGPERQSANGLYRSTAHAARRDPATPDPEPGQPTWALAFGDSFTHCDDVPGDATWQHFLARQTGRSVVNFGVPAYGVDQALLRYRRVRAEWPSRVVLIGFMADNIARHVNRYRPFISPREQVFFAKPRFVLRGERLELLPQPFDRLEDYWAPGAEAALRDAGREDAFYHPERYEARATDVVRVARVLRSALSLRGVGGDEWRALYSDPAVVDLAARVVREFAAEVKADGREPVVVFLPDRSVWRDARDGRVALAAPLLARLTRDGLRVLDLTEPVAQRLAPEPQPEKHFLPHYSRELNEAVARFLATRLAEVGS